MSSTLEEEASVSSDEESIRAAILEFYEALDDLLLNKGTARMGNAWHHCEFASTVHPFGHWAVGWNEVWATYQETAAVFAYYRGHAGRTDGIGTIHKPRIVAIVGNMAYVVGVYRSVLYFPNGPKNLSVNCTNVLLKEDGVWKIIHHHADQAPADYQQSIADLIG